MVAAGWMSSNLCFSALSENLEPTPASQRRGEERAALVWDINNAGLGITQLFSGDPNIPGRTSQQSGVLTITLHTQADSEPWYMFHVSCLNEAAICRFPDGSLLFLFW